MTLTVITVDGATESYDGKCEVEAGGVLKITPEDDSKPLSGCLRCSGERSASRHRQKKGRSLAATVGRTSTN
jgi:hypothetical protein